MHPRYELSQTWKWNLEHAPALSHAEQSRNIPSVPGNWSWCGLPVDSPLGIPAGPLLNGRWLLFYASLGFDILVYKTVRSSARDCYELPNLVPVDTGPLVDSGKILPASPSMQGSWAVSFGMPSQSADIWRKDVEETRRQLPRGKALIVSVVGSQDSSVSEPIALLQTLADDFALCAKWAADSGAHGIEANFSCPNVLTADGQLYQKSNDAAFVAERIRRAIGSTPLVIKIGRVPHRADAQALVESLSPFINGLAMTNSIPAHVQSGDGSLLFAGQQRGICGKAIQAASVEQIRMFAEVIIERQVPLQLIGVGGVSTANCVRNYLDAGATSVALATSAMVDPLVGLRIRKTL